MNTRSLLVIIAFALSVGSVFAEQYYVVTFPKGHLSQTTFTQAGDVELGRRLACGLTNMFIKTGGEVQLEDHLVQSNSADKLSLSNGVVLEAMPFVSKKIDLFGAKVAVYGLYDDGAEISAIASTDSRLTGDWLRSIAMAYLTATKALREVHGSDASEFKFTRHIATQLSVYLYEKRSYGFSMSEEKRLIAVRAFVLGSKDLHESVGVNTYTCFSKRVGDIWASNLAGFRDGNTIGLEAAQILKEIVDGRYDVNAAAQKKENRGTADDLDLIGTRIITGK